MSQTMQIQFLMEEVDIHMWTVVRVVFFIAHRVLVRQLIIPIIVYYYGGFEQIMERSSDAGV